MFLAVFASITCYLMHYGSMNDVQLSYYITHVALYFHDPLQLAYGPAWQLIHDQKGKIIVEKHVFATSTLKSSYQIHN
jgi:hypothetical protein